MAKETKTVAASVSPESDGKSDFVVTDKAPPRVAGLRVKKGDAIRLTDDQAFYELLALHIRPKELEEKSTAGIAETP